MGTWERRGEAEEEEERAAGETWRKGKGREGREAGESGARKEARRLAKYEDVKNAGVEFGKL